MFVEFKQNENISLEKAEKKLKEVFSSLEQDLNSLSKVLSSTNQLEALKKAFLYSNEELQKVKNEEKIAKLLLLPTLLQSTLVSTLNKSKNVNYSLNLKGKDWKRILELNDSVLRKLIRFSSLKTEIECLNGNIEEEDRSVFFLSLISSFIPCLENSENIKKKASLLSFIFEENKDEITSVFCQNQEMLLDEMEELNEYSLVKEAMLSLEISVFNAQIEEALEKEKRNSNNNGKSYDELYSLVLKKYKLYPWFKKLNGLKDDYDLFRPEFKVNFNKETQALLFSSLSSVNIISNLKKGYFPSTLKPLIRVNEINYSFVDDHIISYALRILLSSLLKISVSFLDITHKILSKIFIPTDSLDVYTFDEERVDVVVLDSLNEINPFESPSLFSLRLKSRKEKAKTKVRAGHVLLIIDPDSESDLEEIGNYLFSISLSSLSLAVKDENKKNKLLSKIFDKEVENSISSVFTEEEAKEEDEKLELEENEESVLKLEDEEYVLEEERNTDDKELEQENIIVVPNKYEILKNLKEKYSYVDKALSDPSFLDDDEEEYDEGLGEENTLDYDSDDSLIYEEAEKDDEYEENKDEDKYQLDLFSSYEEDELTRELDREDEEEFREEEDKEVLFSGNEEDILLNSVEMIKVENDEDLVIDKVSENELLEKEVKSEVAEDGDKMKIENEKEEFIGEEESINLDEDGDYNEDTIIGNNTSTQNIKAIEKEEVNLKEKKEDDPLFLELDGEKEVKIILSEASEEGIREEKKENKESSWLSSLLGTEFSSSYDEEKTSINEADSLINKVVKNSDEKKDDILTIKVEKEIDEENYQTSTENISSTLTFTNQEKNDEKEENKENDKYSQLKEEFDREIKKSELSESEVKKEIKRHVDPYGSYYLDEESDYKPFSLFEEKGDYEAPEYDSAYLVREEKKEEVKREYENKTESIKEENIDKEEEKVLINEVNDNQEAPLPSFLAQIKEILSKEKKKGAFFNLLKESDEDFLSYLEEVIKKSFEQQKDSGRDKVFTIFDSKITVLLASDSTWDNLRKGELLNNAGAVMVSKGEKEWNALLLYINSNSFVEKAVDEKINRQSFTLYDWKRVQNIGQMLKEREKK